MFIHEAIPPVDFSVLIFEINYDHFIRKATFEHNKGLATAYLTLETCSTYSQGVRHEI